MQSSILLGLYLKPSYGYKLIRNIQNFSLVKGQAQPEIIYQHLYHDMRGTSVGSRRVTTWRLSLLDWCMIIYKMQNWGRPPFLPPI